ncbi:MAG: EFR1 family ferrodoxin [Anaerolineae bacterium]|jgi:NAD-dependent dihydropyrimidine dehydrogenase PreA subunit/flavodoxin
MEIYYFSGSGNSLAVARDMAENLDARLIPVVSALDQERVDSEADSIGVVFPIYDFKPPEVVETFIRKLEDIDAKYLFAVCTYGIAPSSSLKYLDKVIKSCGGHLSAGFAVGMPHSGVGGGALTQAERESMLENWKGRCEAVCEHTNARKEGTIESSSLLLGFLNPRILKMMPSALKLVLRMLLKGTDSLAFTASEDCNGCGVCERVCPMKNVEMVDDRPVWSDNCAGCFACLHWCPQEAISLGGLDMNIKTYHHPDVKISDMMRRNFT